MMSEEFPWKILDVGAGPLTSIGKTICGGSNGIEIIAVDPLAWEYDQLLAKYNIKPIVRTHMADAENLRNYVVPGELRFRDDTFDLVFCRNALDHCRDPRKALQEMIAVVKPGAYVLLEHRPDEALRTKWSGFHQWNLGMDEATVDLLLSSRWRTWNLSKSLKPLGSVHCEIIEENGEEWLITRIMKGLRTHEKTKLV